MFVAGSAVFGAEDPAGAVSMLRQLAVTGAAAADGQLGGRG